MAFSFIYIPELCLDHESDSNIDSEEEDEEPEGQYFYGDSLLRVVEPTEKDLTLNFTCGAQFTDVTKWTHTSTAAMAKAERVHISSILPKTDKHMTVIDIQMHFTMAKNTIQTVQN